MILGITGILEDATGRQRVAGSGKDTVADLLCTHFGFAKISLADPMKRICRDIFDFSHEQMWGPSETRNAPDTRYPRGFRLACGCLAAMDGLVEEGEDLFLARALEACEREHYSVALEGGARYLIDKSSPRKLECLTPRLALIRLGTEWGRVCFPDLWARRCLEDIARMKEGSFMYTAESGVWSTRRAVGYSGYAIPDMRFINEYMAVREYGGRTLRVKRKVEDTFTYLPPHVSERELVELPDSAFDHIIENNGSLGELEEKVLQLQL